jgi:phosphatidate cytidylyltransferase
MNNLLARSLSGIIYVLLVVAALMGGPNYFIPLFAVWVAVCLWEFLKTEIPWNSPAKFFGVISGTLLFIISAYSLMGQNQLLRYLPLLLSFPFLVLLNGLLQPKSDHFKATGSMLLSFFYIVLPFILLSSIQLWHKEGMGFSPVLGIFILFWANDTGAYIAGKSFGKRLLLREVSPKKTWEGFIGGALLCLVASYILSIYSSSLNLKDWLIIGAIVAIFGTLGDLVESMWKRHHGLKDSGKFMPGHGGLLDRFDGFLVAVPAIHLYLLLLQF